LVYDVQLHIPPSKRRPFEAGMKQFVWQTKKNTKGRKKRKIGREVP
jgi:hypothetical protein